MEPNRVGDIPQVGRDSEFDPLRAETISDRVDCVVRNTEAVHFNVADGERGPGLKQLDRWFEVRWPLDGGRGEPGHVNRYLQPFRQARQSTHMIGMLMSDEDGVQAFRILTDGNQPFASLLEA